MKSAWLAILAVLAAPVAYAQAPRSSMTPAQRRISWAQAAIQANPERSQPYNELAAAYLRRVRETSDASYYGQADAALQKSMQLSPGNFEAQKTQVMALFDRKEFAKSLESAKAMSRTMPDDVQIYGMVAHADMELGNYKDAEKAVQWMLDLRAGNVAGLLRGAKLRRTFGDTEGAMDFYSQAYQQMPPTQTEDQAWILTQMADLDLACGNIGAAEKLLQSALDKFPNYYLAIESQARLRLAQQRPADAVALLRERNQNFPSLQSQYALARALETTRQSAETDAAYSQFERGARGQIDAAQNANAELVEYYLGRGNNPAEALRIARVEIARRRDVETVDAYAWALYANGQFQEARTEMASVLGVGVREAAFFYHAGAIASRLNDAASASRYLNDSLQLNSSSECAGRVREELEKLHPASASASEQVRRTE